MHTGILGDTLDNVILGQLPKRIVIGFVDNRAFNGSRAKNPINFHHFNINYLSLYVDDFQVPIKTLQPRFGDAGLYVEAFQTLFSGTDVQLRKRLFSYRL